MTASLPATEATDTANTAVAKAVTAQFVADWLRENVRAGRMVPGQRLVEAQVMRSTGASRSRVREALHRLEAEGLVTIEEFRGASVKSFDMEETRQLYRARMALEGMAAHDFAASGSAEAKSDLQRIQGELDAIENVRDHNRFRKLNDEWHAAIVAGAGNVHIHAFVERLRVPVYRMLFGTFYKASRIDTANEDHQRITAAILKGQADEAERLMRRHIETGLQALEDLAQES